MSALSERRHRGRASARGLGGLRRSFAVLTLLGTATVASAQSGIGSSLSDDPQRLLQLQRVLQDVKQHVAASVVKVETFGGTRRSLATGHARADGAARPARPADPEAPPKKKGDAPVGPLVMPGFLQAQGATTGVVIAADGWIVVSRFALNFDPSTILVTLADGRSLHAERAGEDTSRGIALLKVDATDLRVPEFVRPEEIRVGQWAIALGRTFGGDELSVHLGIVSANGRLFGRAVQVDAYTSPANYGGPVVDVRGRVLGVSVPLSPSGRDAGADWYDSGIGFATTLADIGDLLVRMQQGEVLHRGFLGINFVPDDLGPGVLVADVLADSPAQSVGLQSGDRLIRIDGVKVRNSFHSLLAIGSKLAGDVLRVEFARGDDAPQELAVTLAALPESERAERSKQEEVFTPPWRHDDEVPEEQR